MSRFRVHTNIALDYPANKSGKIYTSENIRSLFESPEFRAKIERCEIYGTFNYPMIDFPKNRISHVVRDAYISDDEEIMFQIETLDNEEGRSLNELLSSSEYSVLAKMVAKLSKVVVDGKLQVLDIKHVHMVKYEPTHLKKD